MQGALIARRLVQRAKAVNGDAPALVVFVHGLLATGAVFDPLRKRVERDLGLATLDITYGPHRHLESIAADLKERVEATAAPEQPLHLVGHSLGGLISRWYLQELGGRASRLVTLATPHAGTPWARWVPGSLGQILRPGSPWLQRLGDSAGRVPHLAIVGGGDRLVPPESAAAIRDARVERFEGLGHNELLYDVRVHRSVVGALSAG